MASWEDGPEYAPVERPSGFTQPAAEPLDAAPPRPAPAPDAAPPVRPGDYTPGGPERPLSSYHPDPGPLRDPGQPFELARSTMTEVDSAWGLVHNYHVDAAGGPAGGPPGRPDPLMPIQVAAVPPPAAAPLGGPAPLGAPPAEGLAPLRPTWPASPEDPAMESEVGFGDVFNAVTVPTFVTLLVGGLAMAVPFFGWLSPLMFILAFSSANRIAYRRHWVRNTFLVAVGALATTALAGFLLTTDLLALLELIAAVSTAICWIVLAALMVIVWQAMTAGEQPEELDASSPRGFG